MSALRQSSQQQHAIYASARGQLATASEKLDCLRVGYGGACVGFVLGEVTEEELEEREAELAAVELRVRRYAAAAEVVKPAPQIGA